MRRIARLFVIGVLSLWVATMIAEGLVFQNQLEGILIAGSALALANFLVKPVINILLLPLNLATLGLFRFINNALTLFVVDFALPQFEVVGFNFVGFSTPYFEFPPINFDSVILAYVAFSFVIAFVSTLIHWLAK